MIHFQWSGTQNAENAISTKISVFSEKMIVSGKCGFSEIMQNCEKVHKMLIKS